MGIEVCLFSLEELHCFSTESSFSVTRTDAQTGLQTIFIVKHLHIYLSKWAALHMSLYNTHVYLPQEADFSII